MLKNGNVLLAEYYTSRVTERNRNEEELRMAREAAEVITVEIDPRLFALASEELSDLPNVTMLSQDARGPPLIVMREKKFAR